MGHFRDKSVAENPVFRHFGFDPNSAGVSFIPQPWVEEGDPGTQISLSAGLGRVGARGNPIKSIFTHKPLSTTR